MRQFCEVRTKGQLLAALTCAEGHSNGTDIYLQFKEGKSMHINVFPIDVMSYHLRELKKIRERIRRLPATILLNTKRKKNEHTHRLQRLA